MQAMRTPVKQTQPVTNYEIVIAICAAVGLGIATFLISETRFNN
jgi:hypothetical protein